MKFYLRCFGSCRAAISTNSKKEGRTLSLSESQPEEVTRLPVSATRMRNVRRNNCGRGGGRPGSLIDWKPSLVSISENNVLSTESVGAEMNHGKRKMKRNKSLSGRGSLSAANTVHSYDRRYHDNYGRGSITSFFPALSPPPFMLF